LLRWPCTESASSRSSWPSTLPDLVLLSSIPLNLRRLKSAASGPCRAVPAQAAQRQRLWRGPSIRDAGRYLVCVPRGCDAVLNRTWSESQNGGAPRGASAAFPGGPVLSNLLSIVLASTAMITRGHRLCTDSTSMHAVSDQANYQPAPMTLERFWALAVRVSVHTVPPIRAHYAGFAFGTCFLF